MEKWVVFYHNGKELSSYTLKGTFEGEMEDTKSLLAHEYGINEADIETRVETRGKTTMKRKLYLAYGSNLSVRQMAFRCPDAEVIGTAKIKGYRLMYKGSLTGAYATIEQEEGQEVPVLVWSISKKDEERLDRYEGYPTFYHKKQLEVDVKGISDQTPAPSYGKHKAMVYIMDERRGHGIPAGHYESILRLGYQDFGFDQKILDEAMQYTIQQINSKTVAN